MKEKISELARQRNLLIRGLVKPSRKAVAELDGQGLYSTASELRGVLALLDENSEAIDELAASGPEEFLREIYTLVQALKDCM